jgi:outer membrane receptor protein involved in Fe transport
VRSDLKVGASDNLFVRYIFTDRLRFVPGFFGGVVDGTSTSAWGRNFLKSHSTMFGWTKVIGPTLVNEARVSWARGISDGQQDPFGVPGPKVPGVPDNPVVAGGIIGVDISGNLRLGSPNFMPKYQHTDQVQYLNTLTWLRGSHNVKFGTDIMLPMNNEFVDIPSTRGNVGFNGQFTGNAVADFLLGYARQAELSNVHIVNQRRYSYAFFVQDDWRPTSKLTLNLGLRYDFMSPAYERDNHMANFDPIAGALVQASDGSLEDRALVKPDRNNFGPRVGAVYQLNDRTVVRGGFGDLLQPARSDRLRGSARAQPAGAAQHQQTTSSEHDA